MCSQLTSIINRKSMPRSDSIQELEPDVRGAGLKIGVVVSRFNSDIGDGLLSGCTAALLKHGVAADAIAIVSVPGALEAPLALQRMAQSGRYDALIALGAVIRGETYHFEIVANESASGITSVQLESGVPIANGILTTDNDDQALARMMQKGADCATTAIEMANLLRKL
jgi:6,7-dimethyl-8-ribityllumazine synthase